MKILVDLQSCQSPSRVRGIGRYSWDLFEGLLFKLDKNHEVHVLINESFIEETLDLLAKLERTIKPKKIHTFPSLSGASGLDNNSDLMKCAQAVRQAKIELINPDFLLLTSLFEGWGDLSITSIPKNSSIPVGVILYDLIPYLNKSTYLPTSIHIDWYNEKLDSLKQADFIFSISESSKSEAVENLHIEENKIVNISTAISQDFYKIKKSLSDLDIDECLKKLNIPDKYILYTGNLDPRKNIDGLILAYAKLPEYLREQYSLVIVTKIDGLAKEKFLSQLSSLGISESSCIFTGYVNDRMLAALYSRCSLFVFPSLHEGFGLPCLEAMLFGAPVIGSNCTSIPEVIELEDALFEPNDPGDISSVMFRALTDPSFKDSLVENGNRQIEKFSWDKSIDILVNKIFNSGIDIKNNFQEVNDVYKSSIQRLRPYLYNKKDLQLTDIAYALDRVLPVDNKEILIDITNLNKLDAGTGIQRVVKEVSKRLVFIKSEYDIRLVFMNENDKYEYASIYEYQLGKYHVKTGIVEPKKNDVFFALDLLADKYENLCLLFKQWRVRGVRIVSVVYDMLPIHFPEYFPEGIKNVFPSWLKVIIEHSDRIISISNTVSSSIQGYAQSNYLSSVLPTEYCFQHLGSDFIPDFSSRQALSEERSKDIIFLMVGTIEPRKGHIDIINAMECFQDKGIDIKLIVVGKAGWHTDYEQRILERYNNEPNSNIKWIDNCTDNQLLSLYKQADAIVASSYAEGFGLPLVEASRGNIPIIARDIDIFREVAGQHAYYFSNTKDSRKISDDLLCWVELYRMNKHPKSTNLPSLSWDEVAEGFFLDIVKSK